MKPVFVFGSNLSGRHGKGAALTAVQAYGAVAGRGFGRQGNSYAIPTKDTKLSPLPIEYIRHYVREFVDYAKCHSDTLFQVTRVGCGLAGYKDFQIAPLFKGAPANCAMPEEWKPWL